MGTPLRQRLQRLSPVVVGDVMLDVYWQGTTSRISPEAPVPAVHVEGRDRRPGGAANVALNLAAWGMRPRLFGLIGADEAGEALRAALAAAGVDCRLEAVPGHPTITKCRVLSRHQQLIRLDRETPFPTAASRRLVEAAATVLGAGELLVCPDYGKGTLAHVGALLARAGAVGARSVVDPTGRSFERYRGATALKPNLREFEAAVGPCPDPATLDTHAAALVKSLALEALLLTRGAAGLSLWQGDGSVRHLPTPEREVFDVTGAGDTALAAFAAMLAAGEDMDTAAAMANAASGCVVGRMGTAAPTLDEVEGARSAPGTP